MQESDRLGQRLAALCLLGAVLFNFPLLAAFNQPVTFFGVPLLYAYVFCAWAGLIALMAFIVERRDR